MGALVFSAYMQSIESDERNKTIDHAIMATPPFLGSMEASMSLIIGNSLLFNSSDDFRKVARTFPSIYELLPVYKNAYHFTDQSNNNIDYFDYDQYWQQIDKPSDEKVIDKQKRIRHRLQQTAIVRQQENLMFDFSKEEKSLRDKCIVICGSGAKTRNSRSILNNHKNYRYYFEFEKSPSSTDGDGTVPAASSHIFKDSITTISVDKNKIESWMDSRLIGGADHHSFFLNNGRVQNIILRFLNDQHLSSNNDYKRYWYESADDDVFRVE